MKITELELPGLLLIEPVLFYDERGYFFESYNEAQFHRVGITNHFVQDNQSLSSKNVIRGMHFQTKEHAQAKLIRVVSGAIIDVVVDLRKASPTFGKFIKVELDDKLNHWLYVPKGFAHGFITLQDNTIVNYKCDAYYHKSSESGLKWNDPTIAIDWHVKNPIVSPKDDDLPNFDLHEAYF